MKKSSTYFRFIFSLFLCFLAGGIGQVFTYKEITTWYATLHKAPFNPPNWVFGPVWILLYTLMSISLFIVLGKRNGAFKQRELVFFFTQLILNGLWTFLFFGAHATALAFVEILLMVLFTILTILVFWKISKASAILLVPYLFWISFASLLNLFIVILNK